MQYSRKMRAVINFLDAARLPTNLFDEERVIPQGFVTQMDSNTSARRMVYKFLSKASEAFKPGVARWWFLPNNRPSPPEKMPPHVM
jgi:hypothetical protein